MPDSWIPDEVWAESLRFAQKNCKPCAECSARYRYTVKVPKDALIFALTKVAERTGAHMNDLLEHYTFNETEAIHDQYICRCGDYLIRVWRIAYRRAWNWKQLKDRKCVQRIKLEGLSKGKPRSIYATAMLEDSSHKRTSDYGFEIDHEGKTEREKWRRFRI
jgi:hypothetical protein